MKKKIIAIVLAAMSVLMMLSVSASAINITVPSSDNHIYDVYQIFTGTYDTDTDELVDLSWGSSGTKTGKVNDTDVAALAAIDTTAPQNEQISELSAYVDFTKPYRQNVTKTNGISGAPAGYYLVKDSEGSVEDQDTYSLYIIKAGGDITISRKAATRVPEVESKQIVDANNNTIAADFAEGDTVSFKVVATLPDNFAEYNSYKYIITDTFSAGLSYKNATAKIMLITPNAADVNVTSNFSVSFASNVLTVSCNNINTIANVSANSKFVLTYDATVTSSAAFVNTNDVVLTYSNDPNWMGDPAKSPVTDSTEKTAKVYTYTLVINEKKIDGTPLSGIKLKLEKQNPDNSWSVVSEQETDTNGQMTWPRIDEGHYKLTQVVTPENYATMPETEFDIEASFATDGSIATFTSTLPGASCNSATGVVTADIVNKSAISLPVTGTMGLVALAGIAAVIGGSAIGMRIKIKKNEEKENEAE